MLTIAELASCGLSTKAIESRVRRGLLHRLHRGVYAVGHRAVALEGRMLAAVRACGAGAVLSHFAAAALQRFVEWDGRDIDVTVPGPATRVHPGIKVHRSKLLAPSDVTGQAGIPVTVPARTLIDLAAVEDYPDARRAVREALSIERVTIRQLAAALRPLRGRRGAGKMARIIAAGPVPTRSMLEDVVFDLITSGGFAAPEVNVPLRVGGRAIVPDFRWPEQRLIVEADGARWHGNELAREDDARRQALLEAHGERVIRVSWRQAIVSPTLTQARLAAAGAPAAA